MFTMAIGFLWALFAGASSPVPPQPDPLAAVLGAWQGTVTHDGETRDVILEFAKSRDRVLVIASIPPTHAWRFPIAVATMADGRITAGAMSIAFDAAAQTLTTTLPADLVPKYRLPVVLHRRGPVVAESRPAVDAPERRPAWTVPLGAPSWADVAVIGGLAIVGAEDGRLHAVGPDGRERWTFAAGGAIRARPAAVAGDVVVQADDGDLYRVDARSGALKWRVAIGGPTVRPPLHDPTSRWENRASAAAVDRGRLFVGTHDGRVLAIDARTGATAWSVSARDAVTGAPVVSAGRVYVASYDGFVYALDEASGAVIWKHDTGGAVTSAVAIDGGLVIAGSRSYNLEAIDAASGRSRWTRYIWFSWVESPAVIRGSTAYVGSSDAAMVLAIDAATGRIRWKSDAGGSAWGRPAVTDRAVYEGVAGVANYTAPHQGGVVAFDRATGAPLWRFAASPPASAAAGPTPYGFAGGVAAGDRFVFAAGLDGSLYAFAR